MLAKGILKKMVHRIIWYSSQCTDILNELLVLVMAIALLLASKGFYDKRNNSVKTPNYSITPFLDYYGTTTRVELSGSCLKQDSVTFNHKK